MVWLKHSSPTSPENPQSEFAFGNLRLNADGTLLHGNAIVHLPPKELAALRLLLEHAGEVVTHQQLQKALWGDVHVTAESVTKCMSSLRERLEPEQCIQTVYKRGYRLSSQILDRESTPSERAPRLAVMPFATGFNVPDYLGEALAEELISLWTKERFAPALVLARDSVFTLASRRLTAQQVGEALHADLVLTGTIRALPTHFRLRAEMIRIEDGTQIWVEELFVAQDHLAGLEAELAQRLFARLNRESISLSASGALTNETENDPTRREAHAMYLRGRHEWKTLQRQNMQQGMAHLKRAIELDPSMVSAHVDLANACVLQAFYGFMTPTAAAAQVRFAAQSIPPSIEGAEAILPALGWVRFYADHDLCGALEAFSSSAHLPHDISITRLRTMMALSRHRFNEAIDHLQAALRIDPFSPWLNGRLAWAFHLAGYGKESVEKIERTLEQFPDHEVGNLYGAIILAFNHDAERAVTLAVNLAKSSPFFDISMAVHAYALAQMGRTGEASAILERMQWLSRERFVLNSFTPAVYVALGDFDSALAELRAAADARCPWFFQMLADPRLKPLHGLPDFAGMQQLLAKMESAAEKPSSSHSFANVSHPEFNQ
jgi:DNA-binding winged helix-turn-helix (wHTH) protein